MKTCLIILLLAFSLTSSFSQKVSLQKWVDHTVDSLRKEHVDTIEYYHQYCGECMALKPPAVTENNQKKPSSYCDLNNGWAQIENTIIYQQKGKYYSLAFDCTNPPIKKQLITVNSLHYFLSIVPVLNKRDKIEKERRKHGEFPGPTIVDGLYDEAFIFHANLKQTVFRHDNGMTKNLRRDFWIAREAKLLSLISADISTKN